MLQNNGKFSSSSSGVTDVTLCHFCQKFLKVELRTKKNQHFSWRTPDIDSFLQLASTTCQCALASSRWFISQTIILDNRMMSWTHLIVNKIIQFARLGCCRIPQKEKIIKLTRWNNNNNNNFLQMIKKKVSTYLTYFKSSGHFSSISYNRFFHGLVSPFFMHFFRRCLRNVTWHRWVCWVFMCSS